MNFELLLFDQDSIDYSPLNLTSLYGTILYHIGLVGVYDPLLSNYITYYAFPGLCYMSLELSSLAHSVQSTNEGVWLAVDAAVARRRWIAEAPTAGGGGCYTRVLV